MSGINIHKERERGCSVRRMYVIDDLGNALDEAARTYGRWVASVVADLVGWATGLDVWARGRCRVATEPVRDYGGGFDAALRAYYPPPKAGKTVMMSNPPPPGSPFATMSEPKEEPEYLYYPEEYILDWVDKAPYLGLCNLVGASFEKERDYD